MILQLQAKVHGLGNLGVSTCTYPIFSEFKANFWIIILLLLHTISVEGSPVGLLCGYLVVCWQAGCLDSKFVVYLVDRLVGLFVCWLVDWLAGFFTISACSDSLTA